MMIHGEAEANVNYIHRRANKGCRARQRSTGPEELNQSR
jgi:hypothetical protein